MWPTLSIDIVAPPFPGHLFPLLDLGAFLQSRKFTLNVLSTEDAAPAIRACGLTAVPLLPGRHQDVHAIANPGHRIGSNPFRLYGQFRKNLALMGELRTQLRERWSSQRPDLVLADFTVPIAGLTARAMGIPWWTSTPSPCAMETRTGTPSYLGGWAPRADFLGRLRDRGGRGLIRFFKQGMRAIFARDLRALGVPSVYRKDGYEIVYSPERNLALGMREFEFDRDWPAAVQFIGPLTGGPAFPHTAPEFDARRPHVLVSLGTHLHWAKESAFALLERVAAELPDCVFHFTHGVPAATDARRHGNVRHYGYFPYDAYLHRYAAAIIHGGTGVVYSCIKAGVPMLVWPRDFDHFDHAARIVRRGLGIRLRPHPNKIAADLRRLVSDNAIRSKINEFQALSQRYDAKQTVLRELQALNHRCAIRL
jgi:UDP:flavonoid glycosyltransferase YjiC (YdhE family)